MKRFLFLMMLFLPIYLHGNEAEEIAKIVQNKYESIRDMKAKFIQTVYYRNIERKEKDTGIVMFKKPNKMKWNYTTPNTQIIVCDGKKIWFYVPADAQVMVGNVKDVFSSDIPTNFLSGMGNLLKDFKVSLKDRKKNTAVLQLIPRKSIEGVKEIYITVNTKSGLVSQSVVVDNLNNETRIELKEIKINVGVPDSEFIFEVPPGIEVIESKPAK